jgi:hypothetical protein
MVICRDTSCKFKYHDNVLEEIEHTMKEYRIPDNQVLIIPLCAG